MDMYNNELENKPNKGGIIQIWELYQVTFEQ